MTRRITPAILVLIVAISVITAAIGTTTAHAYVFFKESYVPREIVLMPSPGAPEYVHPGSTIAITLSSKYSSKDVDVIKLLSPPNNPEITLSDLTYIGNNTIIARIPTQDAFSKSLDGVYFLYIKFKDGNDVLIPNAVWISTSIKTKLKVAHISDTHTLMSGGGWVDKGMYITYIEGALSALTYAILKNVDMVILSGDVCDLPSDSASYSIWLDMLTYTTLNDIPVYIGKGNHDDPPTVFMKYLAPTVYNVFIDKFEIIFLDSGGDRGYPTMDQLKLLENMLKNTEKFYKIVVVHHPPFTTWQWWLPGKQDPPFYGWVNGSWDANEWTWSNGTHTETRKWTDFLYISYAKYGVNESREFFRIIDKYNIKVVLAGHVHTHRLVIWNGEHYFHTETTTSQINAHPEDTINGMNILEFDAINNSFKMLDVSGMDGMSVAKVPYSFNVLVTRTSNTISYVFINGLNETLSGSLLLPGFSLSQIISVETNKGSDFQKYILSVGSYMLPFVLINVSFLPNEESSVILHASDTRDTEKPTVQLHYMSPSKPKEGKSVMIQVKATDDSSGVYMVYAVYKKDGEDHKVVFKKASGEFGETLFSYTFSKTWAGMSITVYAVDASGKTSDGLVINVPVQTSQATPSPSPSPSPTPAAGGLSTGAIVGIVIAVIVIIGVGAYFAMRKK